MRLAISNIAWDLCEDDAVSELLIQYNIDAIDIAPGKYFPDPTKATNADIIDVKQWWNARGIEITGMQSLLFGTKDFNIFGSQTMQEALLEYLSAVCRIGSGLGASRLVFGSPKNRDRSGLSDEQASNTAVSFFRRLGDIAQNHHVIVCLEPNPSCYGANFMTTSSETAAVVKNVDHPAIKMQLDMGALTINSEHIESVLADNTSIIGHIHVSEPDLLPIGDRQTDHRAIYYVLKKYLPTHIVSIEMLATKNEPHLISIERALIHAIECYRPQETAKP